jgi:hypothetical protein
MHRIVRDYIAAAVDRARPDLERYIAEHLEYPEAVPLSLAGGGNPGNPEPEDIAPVSRRLSARGRRRDDTRPGLGSATSTWACARLRLTWMWTQSARQSGSGTNWYRDARGLLRGGAVIGRGAYIAGVIEFAGSLDLLSAVLSTTADSGVNSLREALQVRTGPVAAQSSPADATKREPPPDPGPPPAGPAQQ